MLQRNLEALARTDPALTERLTWPVRSSHVVLSEGPPTRLGVPFTLSSDETSATLESAAHEEVVLLGIGLGEQAIRLLERDRTTRVMVWDRDPWLLHLTLGAHDLSAAIVEGRLRLALGADLLALPEGLPVIWNPKVREEYGLERALVESGVGERRVALGVDRLLVDDVAASLRAEGYSVCPVDFDGWSAPEIAHAFERINPEFVLTINYQNGLPEFCRKRRLAYVCWEVDPCTDRRVRIETVTSHVFVFSYRRSNVEAFRSQGFEHAAYLPLASDPDRRRPVELQEDEKERFSAEVCFVGNSMVETADRHRGRFVELYRAWYPDGPGADAECERRTKRILDRQQDDYSRYTLAEDAGREFVEVLSAVRAQDEVVDPVSLLAEVAASEKRLRYVSALGRFGIRVWGDPGWRRCDSSGARYMGGAGHRHDLARIYGGAKINVDIGRVYQQEIVTLRVFDVLACGGFLLAERGQDLDELFELGTELDAYSTLEELLDKVAYYLAHPETRAEISKRGRAAVLERHRVRFRLREMRDAMASSPGF